MESTVLVEQKPLTTMQFYLLQTTILVETTVIVEQKPLTVFSTITVVACIFRFPTIEHDWDFLDFGETFFLLQNNLN